MICYNKTRGDIMALYTEDKDGLQLPILLNKSNKLEKSYDYMFRIIMIKKGSGILSLNKESVIVSAPCVFYLNSYDEVYVEKSIDLSFEELLFSPTTIDRAFTVDAIYNDSSNLYKKNNFDLFLLNPFLYKRDYFKGFVNLNLKTFDRFDRLFDNITVSLTELKKFWRCRSRAILIEFLLLTQHTLTDHNPVEQDSLEGISELIKEVILHLHTFYDKKITIVDLANEFGTNRTTLSDKFKNETGLTINKYISKIRIDVSSTLLRETLLPIAEVAENCGYNDITHFNRTFKKVFEMTPSKYREKMFGTC
jgi:AraC family L-rhamnose operon regulatory protein RhaS